MIPDPLEKTVLIPIKIVNGKVEFFYGGPLPILKEGVVGELIVPRFAVTDKLILEKLEREDVIEMLPLGTLLRVQVNPDLADLSDNQKKYLTKLPPNISALGGFFVDLILDEALNLRTRGTKLAELSGTLGEH